MAAVREAPDAVWAIHDANYATEPEDWVAFMARLQYLAEMRIGVPTRRAQAQEDAAFDKVAKQIEN